MHLFSFRKIFCDLFLLFFFCCNLLGMVTEKRCGRVGRGEDAWCVQYDSTELHVCELCGHEVCREFLVNPIVVHMK